MKSKHNTRQLQNQDGNGAERLVKPSSEKTVALAQALMKVALTTTLLVLFLVEACPAKQDELKLLEGETKLGDLKSLRNSSLQFAVEKQTETFTISELEKIRFSNSPSEPAQARFDFRLQGGSQFAANSLSLQSGRVSFSFGDIENQLTQDRVLSIRFLTEADQTPLDQAWQTLIDGESEQDIVVIRKALDDGTIELIPYEGVIISITESQVLFSFDETEVPVETSRIEGVRFYQSESLQDGANAACRLESPNGIAVYATQLEVVEPNRLAIETNGQDQIQFPLGYFAECNFAFDRIRYLDTVRVEAFEWRPYIPSRVIEDRLRDLSKFRVNESYSGEPLTLEVPLDAQLANDSKTTIAKFAHGFSAKSASRMVFELPDGYQRLVGLAGIDPQVKPGGHVTLTLRGDGRTLLQETITGRDITPLEIDLDVSSVRRLTVDIGFGENLDIADQLNLCSLRLQK